MTPQEIGELKLWEALEACDGRVGAAAARLGIPLTSMQGALAGWAKHLAEGAAKLRAETGYSRGRPGQAEHQISREAFLDAWGRHEQRINGVATELEIDRFVVRRLARLYDAPGAPPPRVRRR